MTFKSLVVTTPCWGANEGQLMAVLQVTNNQTEMTIKLTPEASEKIIEFCAEMLAESARKAATCFGKELLESVGPKRIAEGGKQE